jgi:hypothetical protein
VRTHLEPKKNREISFPSPWLGCGGEGVVALRQPTNWLNAPTGTNNPATIPAALQARFYRLFRPRTSSPPITPHVSRFTNKTLHVKTKLLLTRIARLALADVARAQTTAFTYAGRFNTNHAPYTGSAEFQFTLWDAASGGNAVATNNPVAVIAAVADGLFTATLDFGSKPFTGQSRFLQIDARTAIGAFTPLSPRQLLTPTPYALRAFNLTTNGRAAGTYASAVTFNNAGNSFSGEFSGTVSGDGAGLTGVNAATLGSLSSASFWKTNGNACASPTNGAFLGTTDNRPLEFKVNDQRALRLEATASPNTPNVIAGAPDNFASLGTLGNFGASFPGADRWLQLEVRTVVGPFTTLTPRQQLTPTPYAITASNLTGNLPVGQLFATVVGGGGNTAGGLGSTAMGFGTIASGDYSTAMGRTAYAIHAGTFVWADNQAGIFNSTAADQFSIRATGGVRVEGGSDASLTSRGFLTLGPVTGNNLIFDNNEIMARDNGGTATLFLNNSVHTP